MFDLWFKLFCWASLVRVLNSAALCMAITLEWNLAFQLQLGYIAVIRVSNDYSFCLHGVANLPVNTLPVSVIDRSWSRHFRDALLGRVIYSALLSRESCKKKKKKAACYG